jgi:hypothetical protein
MKPAAKRDRAGHELGAGELVGCRRCSWGEVGDAEVEVEGEQGAIRGN